MASDTIAVIEPIPRRSWSVGQTVLGDWVARTGSGILRCRDIHLISVIAQRRITLSVANIDSSLFSEGEVKAHKETVVSLVEPSGRRQPGPRRREVLMPGKTCTAVHKRVVAVANGERINVSQLARITD